MKKLVIKTACITLACIILLVALVYGIFALFIPRPLADFFYDTGSYNAGIRYYEKQYEKTKDIEDLYTLCLKLDEDKDKVKIEQYTSTMMQMENFDEFSNSKDEQVNIPLSTKEYIQGKYIVALFANDGIDKVIIEGNAIIDEYGYTLYNCYNTLITAKGSTLSAQDKAKLKLNFAGLLTSGKIKASELENFKGDGELLNALG